MHAIPGAQIMKHIRKEAQLHTSDLLGTENEMLHLSTMETTEDAVGWSGLEHSGGLRF